MLESVDEDILPTALLFPTRIKQRSHDTLAELRLLYGVVSLSENRE